MNDIVNFDDSAASLIASMDLTPEEALDYFRAKGLRPTFDYRDMIQDEHRTAFTVAKMLDEDLLKTVKSAVDEAIVSGKSQNEFIKEMTETLKNAGWWGRQPEIDPLTGQTVNAQLGSAARLETIFRTNMLSAYSIGHSQAIADNSDVMPYIMYDAVDDGRTRKEHAKHDGKVYRFDDVFWRYWTPPNGYNCRCGRIQLSQRQLEALGKTEADKSNIRLVDWTNPRTGKTYKVPEGIEPTFAYNPAEKRLEELEKLKAAKKEEEINAKKLAEKKQKALEREEAKKAKELERAKKQDMPTKQLEIELEQAKKDTNKAKEKIALAQKTEEKTRQADKEQLIKVLLAENVLHQKTGNAKGRTKGGFYTGEDGVKRYVKLYDNPLQAYTEAVTNSILLSMGIAAVRSDLVVNDNNVGVVSEEIADNKGELGAKINADSADTILDSAMVDVWLGNQDILGDRIDNIVIDGKDNLIRVDSGSTLFYAKDGKKAESHLDTLIEFDNIATINPTYKAVFSKSGITSFYDMPDRALEQINRIEKLGMMTGNYESLVPSLDVITPEERQAVLNLLRRRAKLLKQKKKELRRVIMAKSLERQNRERIKPMSAKDIKAAFTASLASASEFDRELKKVTRELKEKVSADAKEFKRLKPEAVTAIALFTGNYFSEINSSLRSADADIRQSIKPVSDAIDNALDQLPSYRGQVKRGLSFTNKVDEIRFIDQHIAAIGSSIAYPGYTSSAIPPGNFTGNVELIIESKTGKRITPVSRYENENEVLFKHDTSFNVLSVDRVSSDLTVIHLSETGA